MNGPLDPAALAAIGDLELVSKRIVDGTISGLHRSPFHGYSAEFSQYRHYRPGDDLKYIDWKLFARTDRLYTKQFRETTNLVCQIALDVSASMGYAAAGGVTKLDYARLLASALAYLISRQGDAVGLVTYADDLRQYLPSRGGQAHLHSLLLALGRSTAGGGTNSAPALARTIDLLKRRGLLVVISDLYDERPDVERALMRASHIGHDVIVFHVLTRDEVALPFRDDVQVEDPETGRIVLSNGRAAATAYREAISGFLERWRTRAATYGVDYVRLFTDQPLDTGLRAYLRRRAGAAA
ncbi:MAG TPA: DUF58 domain-containing protein [Vicinamibacterales bacterium]|nr:DUF58 domain-containing protein [Vicinamibacterales bacterium]